MVKPIEIGKILRPSPGSDFLSSDTSSGRHFRYSPQTLWSQPYPGTILQISWHMLEQGWQPELSLIAFAHLLYTYLLPGDKYGSAVLATRVRELMLLLKITLK